MIRCIGVKVDTLCNFWLHYPIKEYSVFGCLKIWANRDVGVLLLLLQLLSMRKVNINCSDLLLLSPVIM